MKFSNLKIGVKLGLGFGAVITLAAALGGLALHGIGTMHAEWQELETITLAKRSAATDGFLALGFGVQEFKNYVMRGKEYDKKFLTQMAAIDKAATAYRALGRLTEEEGKLLGDIADGTKKYREGIAKLVEMRAKQATVTELDAAVSGIDRPIAAAFTKFLELSDRNVRKASVEMDAVIAFQQKLVGGALAAIVALGGLLAFLITRAITRPLREAVAVADAVAGGDLSSAIEVRSQDETGQLLQALKNMSECLSTLARKVRTASDAIGTASGEIATGNADLSSRTEEQASSLEETASSMEELTSTVKQNAENARQANQLAAGASSVAVKGGRVVSEVVGTMEAISGSSKQIADIIGVIDGIAFQTNILALNAAVEAARAGEQGRGFAVVATEVRSLAQKSAGAAKQIKTLIEASVAKVEAGSRQVHDAGRTMEEIVASVKRVSDIMSEITAASQEQSAGIEQVNQAITQMDQVTQQNAALVEEAAAAAESLKDQARDLVATVGVFKIAGVAHPGGEAVTATGTHDRDVAIEALPERPANVTRLAQRGRQATQPAQRGVESGLQSTGTDGEWQKF